MFNVMTMTDDKDKSRKYKCKYCAHELTSEQPIKKCPQCQRKSLVPYDNQEQASHIGEDTRLEPPQRWIFFLDQYKKPCVAIKSDVVLGTQAYPLSSEEFKAMIFKHIVDIGKAPTSERVSTLIAICKGRAYGDGIVYPLHTRVTESDGKIYIDLGDESWRCVEIDKEGWRFVTLDKPLFRRYNHMQPIDVADKGTREDLDRFFNMLHIVDADMILVKAASATMCKPGIPHVILTFNGPQGSSKTTTCKAIRSAIDPSTIPALAIKNNNRELGLQLAKHWAPAYDNITQLTEWQMDALCRASTGEGIENRQLYTDDDDRIYQYKRCLILNGISTVGTRSDFLERCLIISLERIPDKIRMEEAEVKQRLDELAPKMRAYLFEVMASSIKLYDSIHTELKGRLPRMADFAVWGECAARSMGYNSNEFFDAYKIHVSNLNKEAIEKNIVGELLLEFLENNEEWKSNGVVRLKPGELYNALLALCEQNKMKPNAVHFPGGPHILTRRLELLKSPLEDNGVFIQRGKSGARYIVLSNNSVQSDQSVQPDDRIEDAGRDAKQSALDGSDQGSDSVQADNPTNDVDKDATDGKDAIIEPYYLHELILKHLAGCKDRRDRTKDLAETINRPIDKVNDAITELERHGEVYRPKTGWVALVHREEEDLNV